jgi:hypothetical protein
MRAATRAACSPETQNAQYCTDTLAFPELSFVISPSAYMSICPTGWRIGQIPGQSYSDEP